MSENQNDNFAFKFIGSVLTTLADEPYMADEPNNNTSFEMALAVQTMALTNVMVSLKSNLNSDDHAVCCSLTRTLLEIISNINYMLNYKDKEKISKKYLETEKSVPEMLYKIRKGEKIRPIYWADISLMKRIKLLNDSYPDINIEAFYYYLSSYAHADAGFVGSYAYRQRDKIKPILTVFSVLMMMKLIDLLIKAEVINNKTYHKMIQDFNTRIKKEDSTNE